MRGVDVNEPKRPNTKPAMAMAAMRVIAIRMTVARTGEIAFLFRRLRIFNGLSFSYENVPVNATCAPLEVTADPVNV